MSAWLRIEALYRGKFDQLCRGVSRKTRSRAAAEDIVHDAFLKLAAQMQRGHVRDPKAYLERAVVTGLADWSREVIPVDPDRELTMVHPPAVFSIEQAEQRERIIGYVRSLPARGREAAGLVFFRGLTEREAAVELGISHQAVHARLAKPASSPS